MGDDRNDEEGDADADADTESESVLEELQAILLRAVVFTDSEASALVSARFAGL